MVIHGFTASELAATIARIDGGEPITRQRVSAIAKAEGWQAQRIGTMAIYPESEVSEYLAARRRTCLLNRAGWNPDSRKLYRDDDIDSECPICGAFAITRPLWQAQSGDEYLSDSWPWLCEQGHTNLLPGDALKAGQGDNGDYQWRQKRNMKTVSIGST